MHQTLLLYFYLFVERELNLLTVFVPKFFYSCCVVFVSSADFFIVFFIWGNYIIVLCL
jgi:hypothetical protein